MTIKINYLKKTIDKTNSNLVLFSNEKFAIGSLKKYISKSEFDYISDLLKNSDLKKSILVFEINSKRKVILISIKNNLKISEVENLGSEFYGYVNFGKNSEYYLNSDSINGKYNNFLSIIYPILFKYWTQNISFFFTVQRLNGINVQKMNRYKNEQDHFEVLRKIQKKPEASQRELAQDLGFSLGKLNYCLKALKKKGLIIW